MGFFQWFVRITGFPLFLFAFRQKRFFEGGRMPAIGRRGSVIIAPNHTALLDFAAILFAFPGRVLRCAVAEVLYRKNIFMTLFLKLLGCVRVDRENHDFSFLARCRRILERRGCVLIFPEARLPRKGEARPLPFKPSAVHLALETGAPILPVYTEGHYFGGGRNRVAVGEPFSPREMYDEGLSYKENVERINDYLRGKIIELGCKFCQEGQKGNEGS